MVDQQTETGRELTGTPGGLGARSGRPPALDALAPLSAVELYTSSERLADGVIHVLGVFLSLVAITVLITIAAFLQDGWTVASIAIYGAGVFCVFAASAAYHLIDLPDWRWLLRRFDHAAIFLKIAGTYTPFAVISLGGLRGYLLLIAVWGIAAIGAPLKLFAPGRFERYAVWLYLVQGWLVVVMLGPLAASISTSALVFLIIGGLLYTVGVLFFLWETLPFHNAIWHGFVLAASACMYLAVLNGVALA